MSPYLGRPTNLVETDPNREIVHSNLYRSLRVNSLGGLWASWTIHLWRNKVGIRGLFRVMKKGLWVDGVESTGHEVVRVERVDEVSHERVVESRARDAESRWESKEEVFICDGKSTEPKIAEFSGIFFIIINFKVSVPEIQNKYATIFGNTAILTLSNQRICCLSSQTYVVSSPS